MKSTFAAKEPDVISPKVLVFLNTENVPAVVFTTDKSGLLSPSRSPMTMLKDPTPAVKSTLAANEPAVIAPVTVVFLNTETELSR